MSLDPDVFNVISQAEPEKMAALQRDLFSCFTGGWPEGHVTCWDMFHYVYYALRVPSS